MGVRTLRRPLWSTKARGVIGCGNALLESAAQALQSQLPSVQGLFLILWPTCHTVPSYSLPSAWASYPAQGAKKGRGKGREMVSYCHDA